MIIRQLSTLVVACAQTVWPHPELLPAQAQRRDAIAKHKGAGAKAGRFILLASRSITAAAPLDSEPIAAHVYLRVRRLTDPPGACDRHAPRISRQQARRALMPELAPMVRSTMGSSSTSRAQVDHVT
jgi:hypothetical protein